MTTDVGCSVNSDESALFEKAFRRSDSIRLDGSDLVLSGAEVELRFAPPQEPDTLGEPLLTAAGERLSFEVPDGRDRTGHYIITSSMEDSALSVFYLLTADTPGATTPASWQLWAGEPDVQPERVTGPGPDTVVIPDSIRDGDYGLCSPYWEPRQFCFTLQVRPASAPWIITAGHDGVILHDRNGTSKALTTVASRTAFYVADRLITQPDEQPERLLIVDADGAISDIPLRPGESLLDVAQFDGRTHALTSDPSGTFILDIDSGSWVPVGPAATDARFAGTVILVRTLTDTLRIIQPDGTVIWERQLDPETMVVPDHDGHLRLDTFGVLNTDAAPEPYFQYLTTELVDLTTGETVDTYEREIAIPDEGQQIAEPCLRAEFQGSLLLCPQPDGRIMTLEVDGGDSRTLVPNATTATYARPISR
ncbi:MAG: hypothetical protein JJE47_00820 [Acidimicrobiia bacterium]|nr:hypothetical protein [Acidimicrobiia bacterium]